MGLLLIAPLAGAAARPSPPRRPSCAWALALLAPLLLARCDRGSTTIACGPDDGLPSVVNTGSGVWGKAGRRPALQRLWRAAGLDRGQELAMPIAIAASPDGRIAVTDFQLGEVVVIGHDGSWLGPRGGKGRGPGEVTTPGAATWDAAGTLVVFDLVAPKALFLGSSGPRREDLRMEPSFTGPWIAAGEVLWAGVQPDGSGLLEVPAGRRAGPDGTWRVAFLRLAPGAMEPDTLAEGVRRLLRQPDPLAFPLPGSPHPTASVAPSGEIAIGGLDAAYRVTMFDPAGRPIRRICRDAPPLPLEAREHRLPEDEPVPERLADAIAAAPVPDTLAAFGALFLGARGRLWVGRDRPGPFAVGGVEGGVWDVFDERGRYLGEVRAPERVRLQAAVGDTVFGFRRGDLGETSVVAYRLSLSD